MHLFELFIFLFFFSFLWNVCTLIFSWQLKFEEPNSSILASDRPLYILWVVTFGIFSAVCAWCIFITLNYVLLFLINTFIDVYTFIHSCSVLSPCWRGLEAFLHFSGRHVWELYDAAFAKRPWWKYRFRLVRVQITTSARQLWKTKKYGVKMERAGCDWGSWSSKDTCLCCPIIFCIFRKRTWIFEVERGLQEIA